MSSDDEIILKWHQESQELDQLWEGRARSCPNCNREFSSRFNRGQCPDCRSIFFASNPGVGDQPLLAVPGLNHPDAKSQRPASRSNFNVADMFNFATAEIVRFAQSHKGEAFYAFAIDSNMLCLNSQDMFQKTLERYRTEFPGRYETESEIDELRNNTGDWEYQGFASLTAENGFSSDLYNEHYELGLGDNSNALTSTPYAVAMDELLSQLQDADAFRHLNTTPEFSVSRVEHNY